MCVGLRRIENRLIRRMKESQDFNRPECKTCSHDCIATYNRCLCAWYCKNKFRHVYQCDQALLQFKGETPTDKPLFTVPRWVAKRNPEQGVEYSFSEETGRFENGHGGEDMYSRFYRKLRCGRAVCGGAIANPAEEGQLSGSDSDMTDSDEEG